MKTTLSMFLCVLILSTNAQVNFSSMPIPMQVVPRNVRTNTGVLKIAGTAAKNSGFDAIVVYKYRDTILQKILTSPLTYVSDSAAFSIDVSIKAEMINYAIVVYGKGPGNSLKKLVAADSIVAGDAFIIQGQSNGHASRAFHYSNPENQSSFIRTWGSTGTTDAADTPHYKKRWVMADGDIRCYCHGNVGQWGLRLARLLLDKHKIPIVIYNESNSGYPIILLGRNDDNPYDQTSTYGRCLQRVTESGFKDDIHGIFWYQGESDAGNGLEYYKRSFRKLHRDWEKDYNDFKYTYIMQIKQGCGEEEEGANIIQEAERQLAMEIDNTTLVSTNNLDHQKDECHYDYINGYRKVAEYLFPLVERNQYKQPNYPNIEPPRVRKIALTAANQLTLSFIREKDTYIWEPGTENDFVIYEDTTTKIISGVVKGKQLVLTANKDIFQFATLSFKGHRIGGAPCFKNINGAGLAGFYKFPINRRGWVESNATANNIVVAKTLTLYPNPAKNELSIQYKLDKVSPVTFTVFNELGEKKMEYNAGVKTSGGNQTRLNISMLNKGIYMLTIQADGVLFAGKFIKE